AKFLEENKGKDTSAGQGPQKPQTPSSPDEPNEALYQHQLSDEEETDTADFDELSGDELLERFERS
ncbi:MAG: hypothetical protein WD601_07500, partial [Pseudohongiellaceae bacterium]